MANDRIRSQTLMPQDLVPQHAFPDEPPEDLLRGLTGQEMQFVRAYVESGDSRQAFAKAGLDHGQKYPKQLGYQFLKRPRVRAAVDRLQAFYAHHTGLHAAQLLGVLKAQATLDPLLIYENDGDSWQLKPLSQWPLEARQAIQKVRVLERVTAEGDMTRQIDIEFTDRQRAIGLLGKHLRLFERGNEPGAPFTLIIQNGPEEPPAPKQVGQIIHGIGLKINLPDEP